MCGIVVGRTYGCVSEMLDLVKHRGPDRQQIIARETGKSNLWWFGHARLAIVDLSEHGNQPLMTDTGTTMLNGEIYNYQQVYDALEHKPTYKNEIHTLDALMYQASDFMRVLDGDFAIARLDRGSGELTLARDFVGVVPLYYEMDENKLVAVASEKKALLHIGKIKEVEPGETLVFHPDGQLKKRSVWDPIGMSLRETDMEYLQHLWMEAVRKRYVHSDVPVTVALSGGLDSSLILATLRNYLGIKNLWAVTIAVDGNSDEVQNAEQLTSDLDVNLKLVILSEEAIRREWNRIQYHLEDPIPNPIKWRGMVRNYFVAKEIPIDSKVILSGEGADELFCGYPSHLLVGDGMKLEWKSLGTFRSMPAINLDRVNKGGLAWGKEYRVPFLDRDLVLYVMSCRKQKQKAVLRELARRMYVPDYILNKPKYGGEETRLGQIYASLMAATPGAA